MTPYMMDIIAKCFHEWVVWHYTSSIIDSTMLTIVICIFLTIIYKLISKAVDKS